MRRQFAHIIALDERIEAFLADVLALEGENDNAIREGVRVDLADCEQIFKAQEVNRRMKGLRRLTPAKRYAALAFLKKSGDGRERGAPII